MRNSIEYVDHKAWSRKKSLDKYTVPKPFNITDERKKEEEDAKRLMSTEMRELEEMKKQFKAKLVNREVLEPKPDLIMGRKTKPT